MSSVNTKARRGAVIYISCIALIGSTVPTIAFAQKVDRPEIKIGDRWKMERKDGFTKVVQFTEEIAVVNVAPDKMTITLDGQPSVMTPDLSILENARFQYEQPYDLLKFPLESGKEWSFKPKWKNKQSGQTFSGTFDAEVKGFEKIQTPAGDFDAVKIEAKGYLAWSVRITYWYAPKAKAIVRMIWQDRKNDFTSELVEYSLAQ